MKIMLRFALVLMAMATAGAGPAVADSKGQRSAQSDCQREVERRGYKMTSTRNFQQYKDGWSLELQARDYRGRVVWGSCYVETRTGDVSLYGFGWGGSGSGWGNANSVRFNCGSPDYKYRECQLPVDGRARLVKRKSDASCNEGRDWGQRGDRVWIDHGCRAVFEVVRWSSGGSGNQGQQQRAEMQCRNQASREGISVSSVAPATLRGSYWEATLQGQRHGRHVRATCRYYPSRNYAELRY